MNRALAVGFVFIASITGGVASADTAAAQDPVAEVKAFEMHLQDVFNSPEFMKHPETGAVYFDDTPRLRVFDMTMPLEFRGGDFMKHLVAVSQGVQSKCEFRDIDVHADAKLAFASYIQHCSGKGPDGTPFDMTLRTTDCLQKTNGKWRIVHEHVSVPLGPPPAAAAP